jgi:radical SAM superfamily enzyme YgiQ (UPF0313 family)
MTLNPVLVLDKQICDAASVTYVLVRFMNNIVLISTYELGHQPFGLASPAAWLREAGASVACLDLAIESLDKTTITQADIIAFYIPMHTATRLATSMVKRIKRLNPTAHLCFYGLYAPTNEKYLRKLGAETILGGEFETGLVSLYQQLKNNNGLESQSISLAKQKFITPIRHGLPGLSKYAQLEIEGSTRHLAGYTEASRGCKHHCRHCPIVPIYQGQFRIVQQDVVLADIRQQVEAGAQHITFGDPDFFNGPGHAVSIINAMHAEFPDLTYDVIIKIEHLLKQVKYLPLLRETGCLFVTSAVESVDDNILKILNKGHTTDNFKQVVMLFEQIGLKLSPTFVAFNPWISLTGYLDFINTIAELNLINNVAPIQYAIRLLIPAGSELLKLPQVQNMVMSFNEAALVYPWTHPDERVDQLQANLIQLIQQSEANKESRLVIFGKIWRLAHEANNVPTRPMRFQEDANFMPRMSEAWYC